MRSSCTLLWLTCRGNLVEVALCLGLDLEAIDCPLAAQPQAQRCGSSVQFPVGQQVRTFCLVARFFAWLAARSWQVPCALHA